MPLKVDIIKIQGYFIILMGGGGVLEKGGKEKREKTASKTG